MSTFVKTFLTQEKIPYRRIQYYISDKDGKKMPIGEKNNIKLEDVKPDNVLYKPKGLSPRELQTLETAYSIYLKYTDNIYCIDVDIKDGSVDTMEDFINKTGCNLFENCCWVKGNTKGIQSKHQKRLRLQLSALDTAQVIEDMDLPGYGLHQLKGERKGSWSIIVNGNC